jgi:peroxiredoxin
MNAYRDQYAQLFNGGKDVTLLAISTDRPEAQSSWAKDSSYVWRFLSDSGGVVGKQYYTFGRAFENRTVYVIGPNGRITHIMKPFNEIDPASYVELKAAIDSSRALKKKP